MYMYACVSCIIGYTGKCVVTIEARALQNEWWPCYDECRSHGPSWALLLSPGRMLCTRICSVKTRLHLAQRASYKYMHRTVLAEEGPKTHTYMCVSASIHPHPHPSPTIIIFLHLLLLTVSGVSWLRNVIQ